MVLCSLSAELAKDPVTAALIFPVHSAVLTADDEVATALKTTVGDRLIKVNSMISIRIGLPDLRSSAAAERRVRRTNNVEFPIHKYSSASARC